MIAPTLPLSTLSHDRLLEYLAIYPEDDSIQREVISRIEKRNGSVEQGQALVISALEALKEMEAADSDLIGINRKSKNFGETYFDIRNQLLRMMIGEQPTELCGAAS